MQGDCSAAALTPSDSALLRVPLHRARRALLKRAEFELLMHDGITADALTDMGMVELDAATRRPQTAGAPPRPSPPALTRLQWAFLGYDGSGSLDLASTLELAQASAPAALPPLRQALALAPDDARVHHAIGSALLPRRGDYSASHLRPLCELAFDHFWRAARLLDKCPLLFMKAGTVAMRARSRADSELARLFGMGVELAPSSTAATQHLVTALQWAGQHAHAASEVQRAMRDGLWPRALQRPAKFTPGLRARPFWRAGAVAPRLCAALRNASAQLHTDLAALRASSGCATQDEGLHTANTSWQVCDVMQRCALHDPRVRATCDVLWRWEDAHAKRIHSAQFSLLAGGGHIRPHTGSTNRRLVIHYTLPPAYDGTSSAGGGAAMRVGSAWHHFVGGGCRAFDDSFEHEVVHAGRGIRENLVLQLAHPGLDKIQK